jgi:putative ABC transport system ATP-binding protein
VIKLENIEVTYGLGTDTEIRAINIPFLHVERGCWLNVIGPSGSGKTTLLKVLSGGIDSFKGDILFEGQNVSKWKSRHFAGCVQLIEQNPERNTIPSMTIEENLRLYSQNGRGTYLSFPGKGSIQRIRELLARFEMHLEDRLSSQVGNLSGGQKQAVALAASLLRRPKVLLLDEFLNSVDAISSPKLLSTVRKAASEQEITVLMVSHELEHVESCGDRLIILSNGRIGDDINIADRKLQRSEILSRYSAVLAKNGTV